ncbi:hypothetical protein DSCA_57060 [Desulfosarcina alkanivorans]|uniref:Uncharacterized protein n=1 Tax=Desulfosarcina alkanivorans TaxID=571177 RepID=A0A5K7YRA5_9BACT|nr:hypothetical protein DSCA_57060 [Desulfosarcina alkanivorans]
MNTFRFGLSGVWLWDPALRAVTHARGLVSCDILNGDAFPAGCQPNSRRSLPLKEQVPITDIGTFTDTARQHPAERADNTQTDRKKKVLFRVSV